MKCNCLQEINQKKERKKELKVTHGQLVDIMNFTCSGIDSEHKDYSHLAHVVWPEERIGENLSETDQLVRQENK